VRIRPTTPRPPNARRCAFTLVELLIVVAILSILTAIALMNLREASRRADSALCKSRLRTIVTALQMYRIDWNRLPFSDGSAGPLEEGQAFRPTVFGDGPAAGGLWNAVPQVLVDGPVHYITDPRTFMCPTLAREHAGDEEHWHYAYNVGGPDSLGFNGGEDPFHPIDGAGVGGERNWLARCLFVNSFSFAPAKFPGFPHGPDVDETQNEWGEENVLWNSGEVTQEKGMPPM
jgi:prepilin-type N-terminal cleavage/methylation domain-containing protein